MNKIRKILYLSFIGLLCSIAISCEKVITDFGFDGSISGTVKDASGKIVPGDITSNSLVIKALGEGDKVAIDMRVKGDGTFQNTKLNPVMTRIWISGPVFPLDTVKLDLAKNNIVVQDFVVVPFLTLALPVISGSPAATSVSITYSITGNNGKTASKRQIFCSTVPYPTSTIGSGPYYTTITTNLSNDSGTASVTGLTSGTKYYLRIGAQASGAGYNYSDQIIFNTP